jgi:general secretion pathway protein I
MRSERGFTLLETLVAFAIAGMALAVLFGGAIGGLRTASVAGSYEEAAARARSRLAMFGRDIPLAPGELDGEDGSGYRWHVRVTPIAIAKTAARAKAPMLQLYSLSVAVSWRSDGRDREIRLDSERVALVAPGQQ